MKFLGVAAVVAGLAIGSVLRAQSYTFSTVSSAVYSPGGIAVEPSGAIFVSGNNNIIFKLSPSGSILSQYGSSTSGTADGSGASARFNVPQGLALDSRGNLYVADSNNHTIRKITPAGVVSTFAGSPGVSGIVDDQGADARFHYPRGLAVDSAGNLYVADIFNHIIRRITPAGIVSTYAGSPGSEGSSNGTGSDARFKFPQGVALDGAGNLYVADTSNSIIRKITPNRVVTTLAGSALNSGAADGPAANARFYYPYGVAVDRAGTIFIADGSNMTIRKLSDGIVTTIGGLAGSSGDTAGIGGSARFRGPHAIAVDANGNLLIADYSTYLKIGVPSNQLAITVQPQNLTVGAGSTARLNVTATGATPITYQWQKNGTPIAGATDSTFTISAAKSADAATYTVAVSNSAGSLASIGAALVVIIPPPNDNFANAQIFTGSSGSVSGTNIGATGEPGEPTSAGYPAVGAASSVWYKWTAPETGTAVCYFVSPREIIPSQSVWTGSSLDTLVRVLAVGSGSADPYFPLSFRVQSGASYYIAVGSSTETRGNFTFTYRIIANDDFARAQSLAGDSGSVSVNSYGVIGGASGRLWYSWTPTADGVATFEGAYIAVDAYVGDSQATGSLTQIHTSLGNPNFILNQAIFVARAGVTYRVAVQKNYLYLGLKDQSFWTFRFDWRLTRAPLLPNGAVASTLLPVKTTTAYNPVAVVGTPVVLSVTPISASPITVQWHRNGGALPGATSASFTLDGVQRTDQGTYTAVVTNGFGSITSNAISLTVLDPPSNDNFAAAAVLNGLNGKVAGTNVDATGETGEPTHWNAAGTASSVWYRWTPNSSGFAVIDTVGSSFDTVLAVYTGSALGSLTRVAQDDDRGGGQASLVGFAAAAGTTYYVAVGGATNSARGNITLNWRLTPTLTVATQPISQTIAAGGTVMFSVTAAGADVTYQWNRNGTAIPGATASTLTVANVQAGADASYTVTVTNSSGNVTSAPATLTVAAPVSTALSTRHAIVGGGNLWSIAAHGDILVAVGDGGVIITSSDKGRTWVPRISGSTAWLVAVTYADGQFVAVGAEGRILTSSDGVTWTLVTATATRERLNNIIYAGDQYVAVGEHGTVVTSPDAQTWTLQTTPINTWLHGLAYHDGIGHFITAGENGVLLISIDAVTWTRLPISGFTGDLHHIAAVDSYAHFVVAGAQGKVISVRQNQLLLKDGQSLTTWTAEAIPTNTSAVLVGMVQGAGALFATTDDGQMITATNDRGPWFSVRTSVEGFLLSGIYHENRLYIVGREETVLESDPIYATRLVNVSTRGQVGTGSDVFISGFIVTGTAPKQILVRAVGPALAGFGVTGQLAAPVLTLFSGSGRILATNQGWSTATNSAAISTATTAVGAFPFAAGSGDCAILTTLEPGTYTAQIAGANNTTGIALVEAYDTEPLSIETSRAINVSTRGVVGAGQGKMIAGFIIDGSSARRVLIRAVGPALAGFGVAGTVAEPQLELYTSRGLLQSSAGAWGLQTNADEIRGATQQINAFAFAEGSKDSAMLVTLLPGSWTVQVGGAAGTSGVALVEVYMLP